MADHFLINTGKATRQTHGDETCNLEEEAESAQPRRLGCATLPGVVPNKAD